MTLALAERELIRRRGFSAFAPLAWEHAGLGDLVRSWGFDRITSELHATLQPDGQDLVVNVPPGMSKSSLACVLLPAYAWTVDPRLRVLATSYDPRLAHRDAGKALQLIRSGWYQERWPEVEVIGTRPAIGGYVNTAGGYRWSVGIRGAIIGRHFDLILVDDPVKPIDVLGGPTIDRAALETSIDWWTLTIPTRLEGRLRRRIVIMQRLHERDLAGFCLSQETADGAPAYRHLCLPMRGEGAEGDPREIGELLCPERYPEHVVAQLEIDLGAMGAAAQLQQRPVPKAGGIFQRFEFWHPEGHGACKCGHPLDGVTRFDPKVDAWDDGCIAWDCTFSDKATSDYVAGQAWVTRGLRFFLLDSINERLSFTATLDVMRAMSNQHPRLAHAVLIEAAANGKACEDVLRAELSPILRSPAGGKLTRASAVEGLWEAGRVFIPHPSLHMWVDAFVRQHRQFPRAAHDDMVDASSHALLYLRVTSAYVDALRKDMARQ